MSMARVAPLSITRVLVYNERMNCLRVYKCLATNRLHGKAAGLWLANS